MEFYVLGLVAAWLSLPASVALVVAGALVVELVDVVAAVVAAVRVATVSPLRQSGLGLFPTASVLPWVSKVVYCLLRGLYHPVLGVALAQECRLVVGLTPPSAELGPDHSTWLPFWPFFSFLGFFGWGSFLGFGVFACFAFLGFFPYGGPMDPPSPSPGSGAGRFFDHAPRSSSWLRSSSGVVASSREIMHLRMTIFHPPFELDGLSIRISFIDIWEHGCVAVEAMLLSEVLDELINHPVSPLSTNQGSSHPGSHAIVGEPFHEASRQMDL